MNDISMIKKGLKRMGLEVVAEDAEVTQYGTTEKVKLLLDKGDNKQGALGLALQADGTYAVVGDPYHCTNSKLRAFYGKQQELSQKLSLNYTVAKAISDCEDLGFAIEENSEATVGSDGMIQMVAVSYAG